MRPHVELRLRPGRYPARFDVDLFLSICQGIGLALAAGALGGAFGPNGWLANLLFVAAVAGGAALFALTLHGDDYATWPGVPAGAAVAPLGFSVSRAVSIGAKARAESGVEGASGSTGAIGFTLAIVALAVAALATLVSPVSLAVLAAFGWLALGQRRRSQRKYEGLRVLR
jgi:hypothetical protein